jgi:hypothetical protein
MQGYLFGKPCRLSELLWIASVNDYPKQGRQA